MKIFVGNLPFEAAEGDVRKAFEEFGVVSSAAIVMDKKGTSSRGFGFVEMPDDQQAQAAIIAFNGKEFMGRPLDVSPARPKSKQELREREKKNKRKTGRARNSGDSSESESGEKDMRVNSDLSKIRGYSPYKQGRRSRSFIMRRGGKETVLKDKPRIKSYENPMRWRKKRDQPKPWQKAPGGESRPWGKSRPEVRPWEKKEARPAPWRKNNERPQRTRFRGRKNPRVTADRRNPNR